MPDHLYRAQVALRRQSGLAEDVITNTFHFDKDEASAGSWATGAAALSTRLATFYGALVTYLSRSISGTHTIKVYNMRDALPRAPLHTHTFLLSPTPNSLPGEVACCVSMRATAVSGENMKRRRGRVYIGPLAQTTGTPDDTVGEQRPGTAFIAALATAAEDLVLGGAGDPRLAIYSPTTDVVSSIDDAFHDVETIWVDNSYDTVRSRGVKPTLRTERVIVG